jgi:glycosyltransferase involved in cell wall biosynthesis
MNDIALVMIVRNEERCIQRCLSSVKPFVNKLVVVDTGSTDATVRLCQEAGAEVHHFEWCDDFSAARNYALEVADASWNLVLDADEWITSDFKLTQKELEDSFIGLIKISSHFEVNALAQNDISWLPRLLPRGVQYQGIVHEQPVSALPKKRLNLLVQHDGYLKANNVSKNGRNKHLLLKSLDKTPLDPYILYQLGVDDEIYGDVSTAADFYEKAHSLIDQDYAYKKVLVVRWLHCLTQIKRTDQAVHLIEQYRMLYQNSADFFFTAGNVFLDHAIQNPDLAMGQWLPMAIQSWEQCLAIGDGFEEEGSVVSRGGHLAAKNLHAVYSSLGDKEKSAYYLHMATMRT